MTGQREFLALLVKRLEAAGIPFMVSGSLASSFHGRPRATNDVATWAQQLGVGAPLERLLREVGELRQGGN